VLERYAGAYGYDMHIQAEKLIAVAKANPKGSIIFRVNGDINACDVEGLTGKDSKGHVRRGIVVSVVDEYIAGTRVVPPYHSHWYFIDAPPSRLYNGARFIEIDTSKPVEAVDNRKTKALPTLDGLGVIRCIKEPYASELYTNPVALPPVFKKGNCTQLVPNAQRLRQLFTTKTPGDAVNTILDTFVKKATELQTKYNSTTRLDSGITVQSFNSLLRPFRDHFGEEVPADSQMEGFLLLLQVVKKKVSSMISKAHPDIQLVQKIEEELNERSRNWLGDGMKKKKVFNIGSVMRTFAYARALVWIATDYRFLRL